MKLRLSALAPAAVVLLGLLAGCSDSPVESGYGELKVYLVDGPANLQHVYIVVKQVDAHVANADSSSGWVIINNVPATYDLLELANGVSAVLGGAKLAVGKYTQIRLLLDTGCTVVVSDTTYPLVVPSGLQTGLKLNHNFTIASGQLYELTLDFNADKSIKPDTGDSYKLDPVIRIVANVISGSISGTIAPAAAHATVWTTVGTDTVATHADTTSGMFELMALPAGTYDVSVTSGNAAYADTSIAGVNVVAQQTTNLGTITLRAQ